MSDLATYLTLRAPALSARLLQQAAEAVGRHFKVLLLHKGEPLIVALPHSDGRADLVEIGGQFFLGKKEEDAVLNALIVLVGLLDADRPSCSAKKFALNIESPERVFWAVEAGGKEIQGGPDPLNQALSRMSCAGEEEAPGNLLPNIPSLAKELPEWEVERLRSCCLSLERGRYDYRLKITVSLAKEWKILARTCSFKPGSWAKTGPNVATYRGHAAAFVRELAKRVGELLETDPPEALVTRWGDMKVAITPFHVMPTRHLF
jgi:hypothetical protein